MKVILSGSQGDIENYFGGYCGRENAKWFRTNW